MNRAFLVCLLLQAVYAERNISISIGAHQESPAGVTYVEGKAPEELKAGPERKSITHPTEKITQAAFIRSSSRAIPKDDEVENEEFERYIKKHHNRPTIETVFVSSSPSPLSDSEEYNEESVSPSSQAEFFKRPAQYKTFERSVALPTQSPLEYHTIVNHAGAHGGSDGIIVQADGGQYSAFSGGQYLPSYLDLHAGGDQHHFQASHLIPPPVHIPATVPRTFNVAQHAVKTKTYEIRRPAIQKHYYDIEERVVIRPAGSIVVELDRPVAKIPTGETIVAIGGLQGGYDGAGYHQSQGGISYSTTVATPILSAGGSQGVYSGTGFQVSQGAVGVSQGGFAGAGVQQAQGGASFSTTPATQTSTIGIGGSQGVYSGAGFQQSQGPVGVSQGGFAGAGVQQAQGGASFSTTPATQTSTIAIGGSQGVYSGAGFQQSQGSVGVSQGGFAGSGVQQSQGGASFSTTPATQTSAIGIGGSQGVYSGAGFQQSQGSVGVSQGGFAGSGVQQSQGGVIYSTTSATPTSTIAIGGSQGGFVGGGVQQSQGAVGVSQGGFAGAGVQQSQGAIGVSQGGFAGAGFQQSQGAVGASQSGFGGAGFQQSQGGVTFSTTPASYIPAAPQTPPGSQGGFISTGFQQPSYQPPTIVQRPQQPAYPSVSTTTASPIQTNNGDSVVVEARSNVQNRGTFSSTTTTEQSFSSTVSQDASAYARASSSGSVQGVSKNITPFMIAVGEPDFQYPPYVEISSNGSPLGHLQQQPYAQIQETGQQYPRMRYQGQLLTGEVRTDDGQQTGYGALSQHVAQQNVYENPSEIPLNTPYEEQAPRTTHQSGFAYQQPGEIPANTQYQHQLVGSTQQPLQVTQISSTAHQQPAQIHQHHFVTTTSQPIQISEAHNNAHQQQYQSEVTQRPIARYRSRPHQPARVYQISQQSGQLNQQPIHLVYPQQAAYVNHKPNLVAQLRHQHAAQVKLQPTQVYQQHAAQVTQQPIEKAPIRKNIPKHHAAEVTEQPVEVAEVRSSTHRQYLEQPSYPNHQYQQQTVSTTQQPESLGTGQRLYQQRGVPLKYTQHHTINVAPSQHQIFFNNSPQQLQNSGRSENLETPPEPELNDEETSLRSTNIESSTTAAVISSTTPAPTPRRTEDVPQQQQQTYATVVANGRPGILYASSGPAHSQNSLRFTSEGSSLFSPSGRHLHLVYSQPSRAAYTQRARTNTNAVPTAEPSGHYISLSNEGLQAQIPTNHQRQIQLTASSNSVSTNEPQQSQRSQPHDEPQQTAALYEAISSTTPATVNVHHQSRGQQKYRNEQTHSALTLRSGRTYGDHRVIASTPAPSDGGAASESVQTRRIVVNHPFQTVQEVVEQEPITKIHQVTVNEPAPVAHDGLQQVQLKASYRRPAAYKVAATFDHPAAAVSYRH